MKIISEWLQNNLLTLNTDKTKLVPFNISKRSAPDTNFGVKIHQCQSSLPASRDCNCPLLEKLFIAMPPSERKNIERSTNLLQRMNNHAIFRSYSIYSLFTLQIRTPMMTNARALLVNMLPEYSAPYCWIAELQQEEEGEILLPVYSLSGLNTVSKHLSLYNDGDAGAPTPQDLYYASLILTCAGLHYNQSHPILVDRKWITDSYRDTGYRGIDV
ncbi:DNA-binding helix-turn-helix protein [Operophtera brumata]|uniref:DNA-binding helix-turn-helix protein n=1 Tax=Operophtera brumata TaxID=104452 RepID=A0A0L7L6Q6_OPEBR|nr:DNA-binding helix-turn-helix protein [Operophtera brumata]